MPRFAPRTGPSCPLEPLEPRVLLSAWTTANVYGGGLLALTADPAGDVYAVGGHTLRAQLAGTDTWTTISGFQGINLWAAAADPAGDIFIAGNTTPALTWVVMEQPAGSSGFSVIDSFSVGSQTTSCRAIAVDSAGDVFAAGLQVIGAPSYAIHWIVREEAAGQSTFTTVDDFGGDGQAEPYGVTTIPSGPNAGVYVVGMGGPSGETDWLTRRSSDGGKTWTTVDDLAPRGPYDLAEPSGITADPAGNLYASGTLEGNPRLGQGNLWLVRKSTNGGATWSNVDEYASPTSASAQGIGTDPAGNVYVVGTDDSGPANSQSLVTRTNAGGAWTTVDEFQLGSGQGTRGIGFAADGLGNLYTLGIYPEPSGNAISAVRTARAPSSVPAPTVVGPVAISNSSSVDANQSQRSEVRNLIVTFSEPVTLGSDPFSLQLLNTGGSGTNDGSAPTDASAALGTPVQVAGGNGARWSIPVLPATSFSDSTASLNDGLYTLTVNASSVTSGGTPMVADFVSPTFHRLLGDIDGDGTVDFPDLLILAQNYGKSNATIDEGDLDEGGTVDFPDLLVLETPREPRGRSGTHISSAPSCSSGFQRPRVRQGTTVERTHLSQPWVRVGAACVDFTRGYEPFGIRNTSPVCNVFHW